MLLGISLLVLIFAGYTSAVKMSQAAEGLLQTQTILKLIGLNTLVAMEVLLPTALYLSIVSSLGRLYRDSEMAALSASGIGEPRILVSILKLAVVVASLVAVISIFGRPWAYQLSYKLEQEAVEEFDINRIEPGKFLELQNQTYVLFAQGVDRKASRLTNVFMESDEPGRSRVIYAKSASLPTVESTGARAVEFLNGYGYLLDQSGARDIVLKFKSLTLHLQEDPKTEARRRKAIATETLARSDRPKDIAEFQWRLSTPVATLVLAMLAVPLSRSAPRQNRYARFVIAIGVYIALFNLASMARNWLEQGKIGAFPGLWWVYGLALLLFSALFFWPRFRHR